MTPIETDLRYEMLRTAQIAIDERQHIPDSMRFIKIDRLNHDAMSAIRTRNAVTMSYYYDQLKEIKA